MKYGTIVVMIDTNDRQLYRVNEINDNMSEIVSYPSGNFREVSNISIREATCLELLSGKRT